MRSEYVKTQTATADEQLIWKKLQKGCLDALGSLYDLYADKLFSIGIKINSDGDRQAVQDGIHDLFLDLYKYHNKLSDVENIGGYLAIALKRKLYKLNDPNIKHVLIDREEPYHLSQNDTGFVNSHEEEIIFDEIATEQGTWLKNVLAGLTDHQQKIIRLRFDEEKTYEEIAIDLNVSESSARTLLYRTLKYIRKVAIFFF